MNIKKQLTATEYNIDYIFHHNIHFILYRNATTFKHTCTLQLNFAYDSTSTSNNTHKIIDSQDLNIPNPVCCKKRTTKHEVTNTQKTN